MNGDMAGLFDAKGDTLCFAEDVAIGDFALANSEDCQCLLIYCRQVLVACCNTMGGDVEHFVLAGDARYSLEEMLRLIGSG